MDGRDQDRTSPSRDVEIQESLEELQINIINSGGSLDEYEASLAAGVIYDAINGSSITNVRTAMSVLVELAPRHNVDIYLEMVEIVPNLISGVSHVDSGIRRLSVQLLHLYLQKTTNLQRAIQLLTRHGLKNKSSSVQSELLHALPLFISRQFAKAELHDFVYSLVASLINDPSALDEHPALPCLRKLRSVLGETKFASYKQQLPMALQDRLDGAEQSNYTRRSDSSSISSTGNLQTIESINGGISPIEDQRKYFDFIPYSVMQELKSKEDFKLRAQGIEKLKLLVNSVENPDILFLHLDEFVPFLLQLFDDVNFKVIVVSMEVVNILVSKLSFNLKPYVPMIIKALQAKLGELNLVIKQVTSKCYMKLMQIFSPLMVLKEIISGVKHRSSKIREATINLITAGMLTFPSSDFDLSLVSSVIAPLLLDSKQSVRHSVMECFSVIAQALGPGKLAPLVSAVDKVEMMHNGEGAMAAVQAKLGRRQLPKIGSDGLIEYSLFLPSSINYDQSQSLDITWVLAGKPTVVKLRDSSQSVDFNSNVNTPTLKRFLSAGKKRLPWESSDQECKEQITRKSVGSAPVRVKSPTNLKNNHHNHVVMNAFTSEKNSTYLDNYLTKTKHSPNDASAQKKSSSNSQQSSYYEIYKSKMKRLKAAGLQADSQIINSLSTSSSPSRPVVLYNKGSIIHGDSDSSSSTDDRPKSLILSPTSPLGPPLSPIISTKTKYLSQSLSELDFNSNKTKGEATESSDIQRQEDHHRELASPVHTKPKIGRPGSHRRHSTSDAEPIHHYVSNQLNGNVVNKTVKVDNQVSSVQRDNNASSLMLQTKRQSVTGPLKSPFESQPRLPRTPTPSGERYQSGDTGLSKPHLSKSSTTSDQCEIVGHQFHFNEKNKRHSKQNPRSLANGSANIQPINYEPVQVSRKPLRQEQLSNRNNSNENEINGKGMNGSDDNDFDISVNGTSCDLEQGAGRSYGLSTSAKARLMQRQSSQNKNQRVNERKEESLTDEYGIIPVSYSSSSIHSNPKQIEAKYSHMSLHSNTVLSEDDHYQYDGYTNGSQSFDDNTIVISPDVTPESPSVFNDSLTANDRSIGDHLDQSHEEHNDTFTLPNKMKIGQSPKLKKKTFRHSPRSKASTEDATPRQVGHSLSEWNISVEQLLPLPKPEQSLSNAFNLLAVNGEEWENICEGVTLIRRLVIHHPAVVAPQIHSVVMAINKEVKNLRSQVSRIAIGCLPDLFASMSKAMEPELEECVKILLSKSGESNAFIRSDVEKAMTSLVTNVNPQKTMVVLISTGASHRNPQVRKSCAKFLSEVAERLGSNRILNNPKDIADRLLPCVIQFALDTHPETRYYGRRVVLLFIEIPDIEKVLVKYTPKTANAKSLLNVIETLRTKGLIEPQGTTRLKKSVSNASQSSVSPMRGQNADSSGLGSSSSSTPTDATPSSISRSSSMKSKKRNESASSSKNFDFGRLQLLNSNEWKERVEGIDVAYELARLNPEAFTTNVNKICDSYLPRFRDANNKVQLHALETFVQIVPIIGEHFYPCASLAIESVYGCVASNNHAIYSSACDLLDCLIHFLDCVHLVQPFSSAIQFGNARIKPDMINRLAALVEQTYMKKPSYMNRHILPATWYLLSNTQSSSAAVSGRISTNEATGNLCNNLHAVLGESFLQEAKLKGSRTKQKLEAFLSGDRQT